jgi:hypothetical protein
VRHAHLADKVGLVPVIDADLHRRRALHHMVGIGPAVFAEIPVHHPVALLREQRDTVDPVHRAVSRAAKGPAPLPKQGRDLRKECPVPALNGGDGIAGEQADLDLSAGLQRDFPPFAR